MAIGTTPLFSKISGSAGPVDFRTRRNGKIEIGKKRIPANPQSTEQTNTRNAYGRLHELWQNAAWIDKTQYENIAAAYDISPWNAFLMRHLPIMRLNPAAYWPFIEGTGTTLHDLTTNENHGTISGATWTLGEKYEIPYLFFDGLDDAVNISASPSLNNYGPITIISISEPQNTPPAGVIEHRGISGHRRDFLDFENGYARFGYSNLNSTNFGDIVFSLVTYPPNITYYTAGSFDNSKLRIYINGIENNSKAKITTPDTTSEPLAIGKLVDGARYFSGNISALTILQKTISNTQHINLYRSYQKYYPV